MEKQIEEMRKDLIEIFDEEYEKRRIITADFTAINLANKGYRKASDVAREVIRKVEQILEVKIINIEEDLFHGTAAHWDSTKKNCYEEILVEILEIKEKYESESGE